MLVVWYISLPILLSCEVSRTCKLIILIILQDLCDAALRFAFDTLRTGGHLVCKFYQGAEDKALEMRLRALFAKVHREKPESSRSVGFPCALYICGEGAKRRLRNLKRGFSWH